MLLLMNIHMSEPELYFRSSLESTQLEKRMEELRKPRYTEVEVMTTAYTLGDNYTPNDIMANGERPYIGAVAYNRVPLGTTLVIDGKTYVVKDRAWDDDIVDIYMESYDECMEYGTKIRTVRIMEGK